MSHVYIPPFTQSPGINGFRLSLLTGVPLPTADVLAATSVYLVPYESNEIGLYDSVAARWSIYRSAEVSLSIAAIASGSLYDVFAILSGGAVALELSAAWASATARTDAISLQDGVYVKTSDKTRRYVGTIRGSAAGQSEDSLGKRFCWSTDNRALRPLRFKTATTTWDQNTPNVWRQQNAAAAALVEIVRGLDDQEVTALVMDEVINKQQGSNNAPVGVGVDSTTTSAAQQYAVVANLTATATHNHAHQNIARWIGFPGLGYHALNWVERTTSAGGVTRTSPGADLGQAGIYAETVM